MDNKINKKRINDHLEYDWYKYLIILIVGIFVMYFTFSQINRNRDYEDVNFFISCYVDRDDGKFNSHAFADMQKESYDVPKYGEALLREISFETRDPLDSQYTTLLQTHGMISSDILIVGESVLRGSGAAFLELTDEILTDYILPDGLKTDDLNYYTANPDSARPYREGIKVSDFTNLPFEFDWRKNSSYKTKYENADEKDRPDENFYLVINKSSVNIGKYAKKPTANAQALFLVNRFIRYYRTQAV